MENEISESRHRPKYTYKFPADKFELLEELPMKVYIYCSPIKGRKPVNNYQRVVKLKCKKCGDIKVVCDKKEVGCKEGLCSHTFVDRTGKRYGDLLVLSSIKTDAKVPWQWLCKCSCGKEEIVSSAVLANGKESCCTCGRLKTTKWNKIPGEGAKWARLIRQYKRGAIMRGKPFTLTYEECMSLFKAPCTYCGEPSNCPDAQGLIRNGIDCVDASKGYVLGNIASCCAICNIMKAAHPTTSFLKHITKIYTHNKNLIDTFNDYPLGEYTQVCGNREVPHRTVYTQFGGI